MSTTTAPDAEPTGQSSARRDVEHRDGLARELGPLGATTLVVGGIIGSGIFLAPSIVARQVGAPGLALTAWIVGGLLALCGALCYAELGAAIPETGGTYAFLRRAYGAPAVGFFYAWSFFFVSATGAIAAIAAAFASYAGLYLERVVPVTPFTPRLVAAAAIALFTAINCLGVRYGGGVQIALTALKLGALGGIIALGLAVGPGTERFHPFFPGDRPAASALSALGTSLIPVLFAYSGWPIASYVAGEIRNPRRNVPLATIGGLLLVIVVYIVVNVAYLGALPFPALQRSTLVASDAMQTVLGPRGARLVAVAVMLSTVGALNAAILGYPRIGFALARDGLFPAAVCRIHPRYQTPATAILLQGGLAVAFVLSGGFERILGYFAFVDYFFFTLAVAGLIVLRMREPNLPRPYRAWAYPATPVAFLLLSGAYLANMLVTRLADSMVGIALTLVGLPFYWWWGRRAARRNGTDPTRAASA